MSSDTPLESLASMYLRLDPHERGQLVDFVGAGRLARIFANLPADTRRAIAETMSPAQSEVFLEPFMGIPLGPDERHNVVLLAHLLQALDPSVEVGS